MADWTIEKSAPWYRMGRTWNISENYDWLDPEMGRQYTKKLKEDSAVLSEGFCPQCKVRLTPSISRDGKTPGGTCEQCKVLHIIDKYGVWSELPGLVEVSIYDG